MEEDSRAYGFYSSYGGNCTEMNIRGDSYSSSGSGSKVGAEAKQGDTMRVRVGKDNVVTFSIHDANGQTRGELKCDKLKDAKKELSFLFASCNTGSTVTIID